MANAAAKNNSKNQSKKFDKEKWLEQKQQKVDAAAELLEQGIEEMLNSESWVNYLKFVANSKFHNYTANNLLLIYLQCPHASRVASYKKWQSLGRQVRKGEKSIQILGPCLGTPKKDKEKSEFDLAAGRHDQEETETKKKPEKVLYGFTMVNVFDVSQTDGEPIPSIPVEQLEGEYDLYHRIMDTCIFPVEELADCDGANGYYLRKEKSIKILASNSEAQKAKTLIHEWGHGLLHGDEVGGQLAARIKELEAESTAFIVLNALGLDSSQYSFGYITHWARNEALEIFKVSMPRIITAAKSILKTISGDESTMEEIAKAEQDEIVAV